MPRSRLEIPAYRKHRSTGRAVVSVYRADGSRKEILLPGKYGSEESKQEYARILSQLSVGNGNLPAAKHGGTYYVDLAGKPTSEIAALTAAFRPLVRLYARTPAAEFGPLALQNLRGTMVSGSWLSDVERAGCTKANRPIGMARSTCNKNVNRIKLLFKWAASMELILASVAHGLATVAGLRRGRSEARETKPVRPISPAVIYDTLPHLPPAVRDIVERTTTRTKYVIPGPIRAGRGIDADPLRSVRHFELAPVVGYRLDGPRR